ncbi:hypothetical protein IFM89_000413 [Coptis chinensis]|uniref:DRBM domain-containing protein n=1 Tax=Coptis chinensis TaxID=261450 RepID=A0A835M6H5_9MAGN|nr:hypothetical protein IFM89_000413 [Coptis chinensis]
MRVDNSTEVATESEFRSTENGSIIEDSAPKGDHSLVPCKSDSQDLDKLQAILASKGDEMLRAALRLLLKQRNELNVLPAYYCMRWALHRTYNFVGSEDDLMLKIESVIQACNVACSKDATRTHEEPHFHIEEPLKGVKRKRLSEAILISQNPCQARQSPSLHWSSSVVIKKIWKLRTLAIIYDTPMECLVDGKILLENLLFWKELDDICSQNNWKLPRYHVVPSNGGFESNVTVQGLDFECSGGGDLRGTAREAKESAAAHILSKLRCMASLTH